MNFAAIINKLEHYHIILIINICLCYPLLDVLMCNIYIYVFSLLPHVLSVPLRYRLYISNKGKKILIII